MIHHFATPPTARNIARSALDGRQHEQTILARQMQLALATHFLSAMCALLQ
jgi:hypothetical protein